MSAQTPGHGADIARRQVPVKPANSVRLALSFLRVSAMNDMQYRANLVLQILQSLLSLGAGLVGLAIVFSRTRELAGWSRAELL
ncbi:MAG TPA: hypothetical protein PLV68_19620, partial [Ilumatobacteraceae bacterium]|nr:hypothetical protein [Ilumatobacteraceae bacterium]